MVRYSSTYSYSRTLPQASSGRRARPGGDAPDRPLHSSRRLAIRILVAVLLLIGFAIYFSANKYAAAEASALQGAQQAEAAATARKIKYFRGQLTALQAAHPELTLSVAVASRQSGVIELGDTGSYNAASVGKLITAAAYLHEVEIGKTSLDMQLSGKPARYWINLMLVKSNDEAWAHLNTYLTHDGLQRYAETIGLRAYDAETDRFPAADAARLLQMFDDGSLLNNAHRQLMLGWLARANYRSYIVPAVAKSAQVYHKVGFEGDNLHDAAIIKQNGKSFALVIFTNGHGTYNWNARSSLMQTITRDAAAAFL